MKFRFDHEYPTVFTTLVHGINAQVIPGDDREVPESTITLLPGDSIDIFDPNDPHIGHPYLTPVDDTGKPVVVKPRPPRRRPRTAASTTPTTDDQHPEA